MNTADYIVKKLEELGVNDFFGLPGDYNFNIIDSIENNSNTKWIGCTNELNAGYAADGYARTKGFGALVTTYGVGELSAINAIAGSYAENIPVVHIVGIPDSKSIEKKLLLHHNFHDVDYHACINAYKNVTAATAFLTRDNAKMEIDRVLKILVKEKKPVYIAIPSDIAENEISDKYVDYNWTSDKKTLNDVLKKISDKINHSKHPVILGDILVKRFDAKIEYKEFVENTGFPVTNLPMGINLTDMDYKNYLGTYYGELKNPIAKKYTDETDCLISVGTIYSDLNSFGFSLKQNINNNIAIYGTYCYVDGKRYDNVKMSEVLEKLTKLVDARDINITKNSIGYKQSTLNDGILNSEYIYPRLQEFFNDNDIIIAETGTITYGIIPVKLKNNIEIHSQMLWASIGWATPAAFGACIAKPQSRVILITGDGAHQISAIEIGNMLKHEVKPIVIIINNGGYTTERLLSRQVDNKFNDTIKMNYARFARVFDGDVWATQALSAEDFDKALKVTQIMKKMCYIEVCTEKTDVPALANDFLGCKEEKTILPTETIINEEVSEKNNTEAENKESVEDKKEEQIHKKTSKVCSGSFKYETVVHEVFHDEEETEEIINSAEEEN